jgi:single-strand DNA-binding protein
MADGMNKTILIGNLGADPELKYTQGGQPVLKIRLATTESWFDKGSSERQSRTEWHTVIVWGKRGEALNKILAKGRTICVEGRIAYRQWEDQNGIKRYATDIVANEVILLGGGERRDGGGERRESGGQRNASGGGQSSGYGGGRPAGSSGSDHDDFGAGDDFGDFGGGGFGDDEIPF